MRPFRSSPASLVPRLVLALACAAAPAPLHGQDTLRIPATTTTTPRVTRPAGTVIARPPVTVTRPPAGSTDAQQLVRVPDLSGRTVAEARRILAASGLEVGRVADAAGEGTPGTVTQQQPRAGSVVERGSDVRLWLVPSTQEPATTVPAGTQGQRVTVPRVIGRTAEEARSAINAAGLDVGEVAEVASGGAPGTVVRQLPAAGSAVEPKSSVRLWVVPARVAQPPRDSLVRVPSLAGQTVEDARTALAEVGLRLGALGEAPGTGTPGTVSRQQPAAGAGAAPGSAVRLWLVPARRAVVPAIMGLPLDRATALLRDAGLRPGEVIGSGRVIAHTFEAGASVPAGSVVNLSLGVPPAQGGQVAAGPQAPRTDSAPPVRPPLAQNPVVQPPLPRDPAAPAVTADSLTVPDVRRLPLADARALLQAAGLAAALDAALVDSAAWTVRAQQPGPGARVAAGEVVALLLDPPAPGAVAATTNSIPPAGNQASPASQPAARPWFKRAPLWIGLAVVLLIAAAAAGARRMRGRSRALPVTAVSARLRMDTPARVAVEGAPFAAGRLRFRMNPGRTAARVAAAGPLFVQKEVSRDG